MINSLPTQIQNLIYEFAGIDLYWKRRFSNDVLYYINKGNKYVYRDLDGNPCIDCYMKQIRKPTKTSLCKQWMNHVRIDPALIDWGYVQNRIYRHPIRIYKHYEYSFICNVYGNISSRARNKKELILTEIEERFEFL